MKGGIGRQTKIRTDNEERKVRKGRDEEGRIDGNEGRKERRNEE